MARISDVYQCFASEEAAAKRYELGPNVAADERLIELVENGGLTLGEDLASTLVIARRASSIVEYTKRFLHDSYGADIDTDGLVLVEISVRPSKRLRAHLRVAPLALDRSKRGLYGLEFCFPDQETVATWFIDPNSAIAVGPQAPSFRRGGRRGDTATPERDTLEVLGQIGLDEVTRFVRALGDTNSIHRQSPAADEPNSGAVVPGMYIALQMEANARRAKIFESTGEAWSIRFRVPVIVRDNDFGATLLWPRVFPARPCKAGPRTVPLFCTDRINSYDRRAYKEIGTFRLGHR